MLKQRIATGVVLVVAFLAALFASSPLVFIGFCWLAILIASWEWSAFAELSAPTQRAGFVAFIGALMIAIFVAGGFYAQSFAEPIVAGQINLSTLQTLFYFAAVFWLAVLLLLLGYPRGQQLWSSQIMRLLLGIIMLSLAWAAILFIRYHGHGQFWVIYVVAVVVCADVGAYFAGKTFGHIKLAPAVSPGKSWEGLIGGLLVALLFALGLTQWFATRPESPLPEQGVLLLVTAVLAGASVLGDLFESMLKRGCGLKDSGNILPGHGGVLDRIDGLTAALPIFALLALSLGW